MECDEIEICVKFPRYSNKLRFVTVNTSNINKNEFVKKGKFNVVFTNICL